MLRSAIRRATACTGSTSSARAGFEVRHDLEPRVRAGCARARRRAASSTAPCGSAAATRATSRGSLASLGELNRADVVFSTVDTVGIPLALLGRLGRVRPPVVYAAIGLPERLEQLRGRAARRALRRRVPPPRTRSSRTAGARSRSCAPGSATAARGSSSSRSAWTPTTSAPTRARQPEDDVVSIGADPRRDFPLLARARAPAAGALVPHRRVGRQRARARARCRANVQLEVDVPFGARPRVPARARGSSRSPCARTRTRARRRRCCRRWRAESPSSSRAPRRSRAATTSRTA